VDAVQAVRTPSWSVGLTRWHVPLLLAPALDGPLYHSVEGADNVFGDVSSEVGRIFGEHTFLLPGMVAAYAVGRLGHFPTVEETSLRTLQAWAVASAATGVLKLALGRRRPYEDMGAGTFDPFSGATSFPSGHTTAAFAVATVLDRRVTFPGSSTVFYGLATLTAASRVYDHKHWVSDVVVGAVIGHISGRWASRR